MDSITQYYREINSGFLKNHMRQGSDVGFEIFYKVENEGEDPRFLKFAEYGPETCEKIQQMMEMEDHQELFIHETDLIRFYKEFLKKNLNSSLEKEEPYPQVLKKAYTVARMILREYFENIGSSRILRTLNDVVTIMEISLSQGQIKFMDLYKTTDKANSLYTHCVNSGLYCMFLGVQMKMDSSSVRALGLGGILYDIGKKSIPRQILAKSEELTPQEKQVIRTHPSAGRKVLNDMKCYSQDILSMAAQHHEKYDGSGYPFGLAGEKISFPARICVVTDVLSALVCQRNFRQALSPFEALTEMKNNMPGHFDVKILVEFIKAFIASKSPADPPHQTSRPPAPQKIA
ncbi:MAG: HD-GYP domain-containing protein [Nitrospinaceae bacterium]